MPLPPANAGCLIKFEKDIIALTHRVSGKLDVPGGTSDGDESAQCTAHREVWEETGFNVEVRELLGVNENGFHVFHCAFDAGFADSDITTFPVPSWSAAEVSAIQRVNPYQTEASEWRFPDQLVWVRDMYTQINR